MNIVKVFDNSEIRFVEHPEGIYSFGIVATDLAAILEIQNSHQLPVDDNWKGVDSITTPGGTQSVTVIWEPGIYQALAKSRKPKAKPFQKWVFEEVLPSIRKTGKYESIPQAPQTYIEALKALVAAEEQKLLLEAKTKILEVENQQLAEAVDELFDYSSIIRIAKFNNVSEKAFDWRKLKAASQVMGLEIKRVPCPRFETKLLYSHDAWRFCYPEMRLPETTTLVIQQTK
jgi:prophage antirepressor-like protein